MADPAAVRLLLDEMDVPAQYTADARWPDGSVEWLAVDFNTSIGPAETQTYRLEYGRGVTSTAEAPRGLMVTEDTDTVQVGRLRFSKRGAPLLLSVDYRGELIIPGRNGLAVTDAAGAFHDLRRVDSLTFDIVKPGPLYVELRYAGRLQIGSDYAAPFVVTVGMPNSKSWVKVSATVDDPGARLGAISFHTPLSLGPLPWVWDFGTDRWTYGSLREPADSVVLTSDVTASGGTAWQVTTVRGGQEQVYETSGPLRSTVAGWGHLQAGQDAVAFGLDAFGRRAGTYRFAIEGNGQTSFRFTADSPVTQHQLTVYEHFVSIPVQIGAATSPTSMLNPLVAEPSRP